MARSRRRPTSAASWGEGRDLLGNGLRDALDPRLEANGPARAESRTDAAPAGDEAYLPLA